MDFDPRDRDDDIRDVDMPWVDVRYNDREERESWDRDDDPRDHDARERTSDPRDPFADGLELPRGPERETVLDGEHRYELNGDDSRTLATVWGVSGRGRTGSPRSA